MNKTLRREIWSRLDPDEDGSDDDLILSDYVNLMFLDRGARPCIIIDNDDLMPSIKKAGYSACIGPRGNIFVSRVMSNSDLGRYCREIGRLASKKDNYQFELIGELLGYPAKSEFNKAATRAETYSVEYFAKLPEFPVPFSVFSNVFLSERFFDTFARHFEFVSSKVEVENIKMFGIFWHRSDGKREKIGRIP